MSIVSSTTKGELDVMYLLMLLVTNVLLYLWPVGCVSLQNIYAEGNGQSSLTSDSSIFTKTGTTIVGLCCREGVVLGADTRSTGGPLIMDKNKLKIHKISQYIYCCAAGTSADCDEITRHAARNVALLRIEGRLSGELHSLDHIPTTLRCIMQGLHEPIGKRSPQSVMIIGGVDDSGPSLYTIDDSAVPHRVNFAALGSGSIDAIAVLEACRREWRRNSIESGAIHQENNKRYTEEIEIESAIDAVRRAVQAGILNDLGSGSHVDLCVIQNGNVRIWREHSESSWDLNSREKLPASAQQRSRSKDNVNFDNITDVIALHSISRGELDTVEIEKPLGRMIYGSSLFKGLVLDNPSPVDSDATSFRPSIMVREKTAKNIHNCDIAMI
jgi:20S proteasome subunit beta 2